MPKLGIHTLRQRLLVQITLMLAMVFAVGVLALLEIRSLHRDLGMTVRAYRQLGEVYQVGHFAADARNALSGITPDLTRARQSLDAALLRLELPGQEQAIPGDAWIDEDRHAECLSLVKHSLVAVDQNTPTDALADVNRLLADLAQVTAETRTAVVAEQRSAEAARRRVEITAVISGAGIILLATVVGWWQYRSVTGPLRRVRQAANALAAGELAHRLPLSGDAEFVHLAEDLNAMAEELQSLCGNLDHQVKARTQELIRAQRLASIGYLAAGVAHEINNPLATIAGYSERITRHLERHCDQDDLGSLASATKAITEEAFRCKQITERLLCLARSDGGSAAIVSLPAVVNEVVDSLSQLPRYRQRKVVLDQVATGELKVIISPGELKQVVINLLANALDAVPDTIGEVQLSLGRVGLAAELRVTDNGVGMSADTLDCIFEPFFTRKGGHGTGLGLAISHAIVTAYGGRIFATSEGVGKGSCFTVRLPLATDEVCHAS